VHFHSLVLDGVYEGSKFRFATAPTAQDLQELVERVARKIIRRVKRSGYEVDPEEGMGGEAHEEEATVFDGVQAASIRGLALLSSPPGGLRRVRLLGKKEYEPDPPGRDCGQAMGFSVHAGVRMGGTNRAGLAQVCRYILRPPFSAERLEVDERGQVVYRMRKPRRDGATHLIMEPVEFMEKLAALVPPPRAHLVHYHGVLGPNSGWRRAKKDRPAKARGGERRRRDWADLLQKTFQADVLKCARCGGRMRLIALVERRETAEKILAAMGWDVGRIDEQTRLGPGPPEDPSSGW
jgi:hypothetical protein